MNCTKALVGIALAGVFFISSSNNSHSAIVSWDLLDHGSGGLGPFYGLRLDDTLPVGPDRLFSFGGASTARLIFDTAGTASISGTVIENGDGSTAACSGGNDDSPEDCSVWDLEYTFSGITVQDVGDPFAGFIATGGSGSVNQQGSLTELELGFALNGDDLAFLWLPDGHRLPGDNSSLVGRGWVDPTSNSSGANDFLFQGRIVPEPGAIALFGVGLIGLSVMRRRKNLA
ncbi:MAG: PEP-CTERM sorting domain-containing protein [Alphaproteobacteria bacterium]|nr:PEP-CTERM sorting domain-containing protein [Alphaproteobacteria bacterium]